VRLISIVVPTLNEASQIVQTLAALKKLEGEKEILVVDGGSEDNTVALVESCGVRVVRSSRGRGVQLRAGAAEARGDVLWFVHADTIARVDALLEIRSALMDPSAVGGNFGLTFDGPSGAARLLTLVYPMLRWLNLAYGDSGIFVRRDVYEAIGGFRSYPLFEDLDILKRLRRAGKFVHLECRMITSSRRFENRNFAVMWTHWTALQILYWAGVPPRLLARWYRHARRITG
jgi:rSAM/selenodomain-associated transferase 2